MNLKTLLDLSLPKLLTVHFILTLHFSGSSGQSPQEPGPFTLTLCLKLNCTTSEKPPIETDQIGEGQELRGDPEDLTPLHPSHYLGFTPRRPPKFPPVIPDKVWPVHQVSKGEKGDLVVAEGRHRPRKQSYNRHYNPRPKHYSSSNRHSDGGKNGKGGYYKTDSYSGNQGYASESSFDRAKKDAYADSDQQQYKHKDGHSTEGQSGGRNNYGHGHYGGEYGDNGNSYLSAGDDYK